MEGEGEKKNRREETVNNRVIDNNDLINMVFLLYRSPPDPGETVAA